jgi:hypothetical protein
MQKGERATLNITSDFAYGARGAGGAHALLSKEPHAPRAALSSVPASTVSGLEAFELALVRADARQHASPGHSNQSVSLPAPGAQVSSLPMLI